MEPGQSDVRSFGMNSHSRASFPEAEISQYSEAWKVRSKGDGMPVCQYGEVELKVPGRIVVAAEVKSHWGDGTNGWWKKKEGAGGIGKDSFGVKFCTEHYRGGHWSANVWSVDGELYRREKGIQ
jgi:hypothetical protein